MTHHTNATNLLIAISLGLGAGCTGGPSAPPSEAVVDAPSPTADTAGGEETWAGTGTVYGRDGTPQGHYDVRLVREQTDRGIRQTVVVTLPDGDTRRFEQLVEETEHGFELSGPDGEGGGLDLGDGMMLTHVELPDGREHAQTIALDEGSGMRVVRTELEEGRAVRFYRETYRPE